ncbi:MAG: pyrimidine dimer DNA glycosylase/endonuclease V [Planctomycetota bacterium]
MRLWTVHPKHLDAKGLVALWREGLLAKKVLAGKTRGYRHHPQLIRFREHPFPRKAIAFFLRVVWEEASHRGYRFDVRKARQVARIKTLPATRGQLLYEWQHLGRKLRKRSPADFRRWRQAKMTAHPLFLLKKGRVQPWEVTQ